MVDDMAVLVLLTTFQCNSSLCRRVKNPNNLGGIRQTYRFNSVLPIQPAVHNMVAVALLVTPQVEMLEYSLE